MVTNTVWAAFSSVFSLLYPGMQVMMPCLLPVPLSTSIFNTDQYMGSWNFVAVTAWDQRDIDEFRVLDNYVIHFQKDPYGTITVTKSYRVADVNVIQCLISRRDYHARSGMDPFLFRNDYNTFALFWDGKFINCPSCVIILFVDEAEGTSVALYDRNEKTPDHVIQEFKSKMKCTYMEEFFKAPLQKERCKHVTS